MNRSCTLILLAILLSSGIVGCCASKKATVKCCPPYTPKTTDLAVAPKQLGAGIQSTFDGVPEYAQVRQSLVDQLAAEDVLAIDLHEAVCLAARNSATAEMIEAERHALKCQSDNCAARVMQVILEGESLEQRNKSAGMAAEIFLGLVQVNLQRDLIEQAVVRFQEFETKVNAASNAGIATADARNQLAEGRIQIKQQEAELNALEQKLTYQLNLLLKPDSTTIAILQPVYELQPHPAALDVRSEAATASANRPGVRSLETALNCRGNHQAIYALLGAFDSRLGMQIKPGTIGKRLLRRQIQELLKSNKKLDPTLPARRGQAEQILANRRHAAVIAAHNAMLEMQTAMEKLALANEKINLLEKKAEQIDAKRILDAQSTLQEDQANWIDLQTAKSNRISRSIEFETAKIKLLQAQGRLVEQCGFDLTAFCCSCDCQSE